MTPHPCDAHGCKDQRSVFEAIADGKDRDHCADAIRILLDAELIKRNICGGYFALGDHKIALTFWRQDQHEVAA